MKVLLLAGGWSPEREVSLKGGEQIAAALKERGHSVTLCDPAKDFERLMDMARASFFIHFLPFYRSEEKQLFSFFRHTLL